MSKIAQQISLFEKLNKIPVNFLILQMIATTMLHRTNQSEYHPAEYLFRRKSNEEWRTKTRNDTQNLKIRNRLR